MRAKRASKDGTLISAALAYADKLDGPAGQSGVTPSQSANVAA